MSINLSELSKLSQLQNGYKINHANDVVIGEGVADKYKESMKSLNTNSIENVEGINMINNGNNAESINNINNALNHMQILSSLNNDQSFNTDEDRSQTTIEMNNLVDEVDEKVIILSEN